MKYIKAKGIEENEVYYFEVDERMVAYRQVTLEEGECKVSIARDFHLIETEVELFEGDEEIPKEEFLQVWEKAVEPYAPSWKRTKQQMNISDTVIGRIEMFYPQGAIIRLGRDAYAITDYSEIKRHTDPAHMYPGYKVEGKITGYDERNYWLILDHCKVIGEIFDASQF